MIIQAKDTKIEKFEAGFYFIRSFSKFSSTNTEQPAFLRAAKKFIF